MGVPHLRAAPPKGFLLLQQTAQTAQQAGSLVQGNLGLDQVCNLIDLIDIKAIILFAGLMAFSRWKPKLHPIVLIVLAAIGGMILFGGILPF